MLSLLAIETQQPIDFEKGIMGPYLLGERERERE
jgi:hypothetical protein